jgi:hypothetical protein
MPDIIAYSGLCNRINVIASALVKADVEGAVQTIKWAINDHLPCGYEEIFSPIEGLVVSSSPHVVIQGNEFFALTNLLGLHDDEFRRRIKDALVRIFSALVEVDSKPTGEDFLGIHFREHITNDGRTSIEKFIPQMIKFITDRDIKNVFLSSDNQPSFDAISKSLTNIGVAVTDNMIGLSYDYDRTKNNILNMISNLRSYNDCGMGLLTNSQISSIPDVFTGRVPHYFIAEGITRFRKDQTYFEGIDVTA